MNNSDAARFLVRLTCLLPLAGAVLLTNWMSEQLPVRRLFTGPLDAAAEVLVSGKTICSQADMLDLKPVWIEHVQSRPEVLVLGSSRVVQIPQDWFPMRSLLNAALPGGDFRDSVAAFEECLETGKAPRLVLLELNPTLSYAGRARVAPALAPYFRHAFMRYGIFPPIFFSGPLTLEGLRWDPRIFLQHPVWQASEKLPPGAYRMYPDGSADLSDSASGATPDAVESVVVAAMHHLDPERQHWRSTSEPGWFDRRILRAFLDDLHKRGIRVVVVLVPVHPVAFDYYSRQGGYDDSWIRREMTARGITVVGSYSPTVAKVSREDFFDDVHVHAPVLHRLLKDAGIVP